MSYIEFCWDLVWYSCAGKIWLASKSLPATTVTFLSHAVVTFLSHAVDRLSATTTRSLSPSAGFASGLFVIGFVCCWVLLFTSLLMYLRPMFGSLSVSLCL
ncbi:hypothetical protein RchiOBHm_Chr1g0327451 [Rosa chinensis]|uniref:Uncharacterized protein n=1 Tax=Rosa chinensis TaxID=74649 RepID=A0A2P6SAK6_ROSCH|nr:hypothetical protein RchiOBHm_Chr1g0327451 [Rosa chinensis]